MEIDEDYYESNSDNRRSANKGGSDAYDEFLMPKLPEKMPSAPLIDFVTQLTPDQLVTCIKDVFVNHSLTGYEIDKK